MFYQCRCSPDSRVLSVADCRELLGKKRIDLGVYGNQLTQSLGSSQPHRTAGVLQGLQEGGLKLREEGLQGNAHLKEKQRVRGLTSHQIWFDEGFESMNLCQQQGQGLQQSGLHCPGKAVSQDSNQRSSDVDD